MFTSVLIHSHGRLGNDVKFAQTFGDATFTMALIGFRGCHGNDVKFAGTFGQLMLGVNLPFA